MASRTLLCTLFIICLCIIAPAMAGTKYMAGSPQISAYVSGTNEFSPGDDVVLPIIIENTGTNEFKFVNSGIVDREDQPNTAKFLTVTLLPGDAPLTIKSDPQMVGDLPGSGVITANFVAKIDTNASAGNYSLPLSYNYTYLYNSYQFGVDTIQYSYKTVQGNLSIPITIKPAVTVQVISAVPDHLNVGTEGYIDMQIQNSGSDYGKKSVVKILQSGNSPILPTDSSVYVGDIPPGSTVSCRYKVSVSSDAQKQTYPVDVVIAYQNYEGDFVTSRSDTIGIPVGGKVDFAIVSSPAIMNPGNKQVINVVYKNTGDSTVYSAQARISAVDPFTSNDDISYLGDMKPGDSVTASYDVTVDRAATLKTYGLDSEIRYRDALDNTYISDTMKVPVNVVPATGVASVASNPVYLAVIVAVIVGTLYFALRLRKR